jgi:hypothetical protein
MCPRDEKFPDERIEQAKSNARLDDALAEAEECAACRRARDESRDPTALCDEHLRRVYGL